MSSWAVAQRAARRRRAVTLIELLVVLSTIGMLMALLLPAVQAAREAARRAECANNLRNVAFAIAGELNAKRRLPASGHFSTNGVPFHDWVVSVLPYLERSDLAVEWRFDEPWNKPPNAALRRTGIQILVCPDDDTVALGEGNLSYVVNGGFGWTHPVDCPTVTYGGASTFTKFDFNGNGVTCPSNAAKDNSPVGTDKDLFFKTGLFFAENWPYGSGTVRHHTADSIVDGLSNTIILAENLWAGYDPTGGDWAAPYPWRACFFLSGYVCQDSKCSKGNVNWGNANSRSGSAAREAINGALLAGEGTSPWPSSRHPGGVNLAFCDGHLRFVDQNIDGPVYAWLVTPQGSRVLGPLAQPPIQDDY
ncbi:MAG: DUF1559 domain-containing protein [Pirellulales bacterium]